MTSEYKHSVSKNIDIIIPSGHKTPTLPSSVPDKFPMNRVLERSKIADSVRYSKKASEPPDLEEKAQEIVITKDALEALLSGMTLDEIEEVTDGSIGDEKLVANENYFEACGSPGKLQKLSPWTPDGPILKSLPGYFKMGQMIQNQYCECLLLHCEEEVFTKNIDNLGVTPWYFLCREHREEVTERYGYGTKKIL